MVFELQRGEDPSENNLVLKRNGVEVCRVPVPRGIKVKNKAMGPYRKKMLEVERALKVLGDEVTPGSNDDWMAKYYADMSKQLRQKIDNDILNSVIYGSP